MLFNIGSLYSQLGARQDRLQGEGLDRAVDSYLRAAGIFQFIKENFLPGPSSDLEPPCLAVLVQLMLSQAGECLLEKAVLGGKHSSTELSGEAAHISTSYEHLLHSMVVCGYFPLYWLGLLRVKREHYLALADYYAALAIVTDTDTHHQSRYLGQDFSTILIISLFSFLQEKPI